MEKSMLNLCLPLLKGGMFLRWMTVLGVFWFGLGIAYIPVNKIYQQGIIAFLFLPVILIVAFNIRLFSGFLIENKVFSSLSVLLFLYVAANGIYFNELQSVKHVLYILIFLFLGALIPFFEFSEKKIDVLSVIALMAVAIICLYSFYDFFYLKDNSFFSRMWGALGMHHPILASYYVGFFFILSFLHFVENKKFYILPFIIIFSAFILFAQSRGAYFAVFLSLLCYFFLFARKNKYAVKFVLFFLVFGLVLSFFFMEQILSRGMSYRPEIMMSSLVMGVEKLWFGYGLGYDYVIYISNYPEGFNHTHNLLLHIFIRLGLIGVVLFSALWIYCFYYCYRSKELFLARFNLLLIIFSSVAFQFDSASFIAQPRLEWFVVWVPVCITIAVAALGFLKQVEK